MANIGKLKNISVVVKTLLEKEIDLRDNDDALVATIWNMEFPNADKVSALHFMWAFVKGEVTNADTITRARRQVQMDNEALRGKTWKERHKDSSRFAQEIK